MNVLEWLLGSVAMFFEKTLRFHYCSGIDDIIKQHENVQHNNESADR